MISDVVQEIWQALDEVKDPEIPVVSLVEMGIVRDVVIDKSQVIITITPTFSGCPALHAMKTDIVQRLNTLGYANVEIQTTFTPAWSSDWISESARAKLREFGLAPPPIHHGDLNVMLWEVATCPYCGSTKTSIRNSFGPTACRMIYYCNACNQPFEQFKPL
ncbi:MAG: phenylacetate-CoA oxygenase subunit PaaJ [Chloroflexi bacterium]|nr:phenylacetate-CoA oxygenase subunit PaaJ [Chloroflexota bacterium]